MTIAQPVKNPFKVLLKAALFLAGFQLILGVTLMIGYVIEGQAQFLIEATDTGPLEFSNHKILAWTGLFLLLVGLPLAGLTTRLITRNRPATFFFLEESWMKFLSGFALGTVIATALVSSLLLTGHANLIASPERLEPQELVASILGFGMIMILVGLFEETVFRGLLQCEWAFGRKSWIPAISVSGLLFGWMHTINFDADNLIKLRILFSGFVFSWFLSVTMLYFKSLKAAIGIHAGWNYGLGGLMGCTVSGNNLNLTIFSTEMNGPAWLTGDSFGLETSAFVNILLILLTVITWSRLPPVDRLPPQTGPTGIPANRKNNTEISTDRKSDMEIPGDRGCDVDD